MSENTLVEIREQISEAQASGDTRTANALYAREQDLLSGREVTAPAQQRSVATVQQDVPLSPLVLRRPEGVDGDYVLNWADRSDPAFSSKLEATYGDGDKLVAAYLIVAAVVRDTPEVKDLAVDLGLDNLAAFKAALKIGINRGYQVSGVKYSVRGEKPVSGLSEAEVQKLESKAEHAIRNLAHRYEAAIEGVRAFGNSKMAHDLYQEQQREIQKLHQAFGRNQPIVGSRGRIA